LNATELLRAPTSNTPTTRHFTDLAWLDANHDGQAEHTHGEDTEVEVGDARLVSVGVLGDGGQDGQSRVNWRFGQDEKFIKWLCMSRCGRKVDAVNQSQWRVAA
ncbi:MAG: hypothetical protein ING36_01465, partial [Burkholderiales bacterium]|nr:hypothetical protein [Burkholderiales bacterium]